MPIHVIQPPDDNEQRACNSITTISISHTTNPERPKPLSEHPFRAISADRVRTPHIRQPQRRLHPRMPRRAPERRISHHASHRMPHRASRRAGTRV